MGPTNPKQKQVGGVLVNDHINGRLLPQMAPSIPKGRRTLASKLVFLTCFLLCGCCSKGPTESKGFSVKNYGERQQIALPGGRISLSHCLLTVGCCITWKSTIREAENSSRLLLGQAGLETYKVAQRDFECKGVVIHRSHNETCCAGTMTCCCWTLVCIAASTSRKSVPSKVCLNSVSIRVSQSECTQGCLLQEFFLRMSQKSIS